MTALSREKSWFFGMLDGLAFMAMARQPLNALECWRIEGFRRNQGHYSDLEPNSSRFARGRKVKPIRAFISTKKLCITKLKAPTSG